MYLLRSLTVGYAIAFVGGLMLSVHGWGLLPVALTVWISGSFLSILIAGASALVLEQQTLMPLVQEHGPENSEFKKWDADLAAEGFAEDLAVDGAETVSTSQRTG
ncbi:MAG: hypothetical protein AAGD13_18740 [Pseudomonadota bacterium]